MANAAAGGFATVQLSSTPTGTKAGTPWSVDLTVLQHGVTPLDGMEPLITISERLQPRSRSLPRRRAQPGVYHADVVFPEAGTWTWTIWDGFSQTHTYKLRCEVAPAGDSVGTGTDGISIWLAGLAGAAALAIGAVMVVMTAKRRSRPSPA